jgi:predicted DNA binding protein
MVTTNKDKIFIQIGEEVQELKGADKDAFIADQEARAQEALLLEAAEKEKAEKKESATNKLKALGLTDAEVEALLG